ncbi:ATP:cob(I)alamin adenosyltransferase [Suicoccus acidiformans]|uniref:Corrinoid adenosyltransferase n=1 Tax=Suicoccus acidiformans TaxID=2036206 RepID=A0A347WLZ6_9LACT|nr:cob(I)yrinic acid a,c-diamide adenosyltransferase [Suicoccus acidiformans]AXY26103.1 ATP:cob(I)alamin adenosyltransferase [Suicoccus acidiformans]
MQLYTRTGDKGYTSIIGGQKVAKDSNRVIAYGTLDELNSIVGIAVSLIQEDEVLSDDLQQIQQFLFDCGSDIATPHGYAEYRLNKDHTLWLESRVDYYSDKAPSVQSFILPGGTTLASVLHFARTVARRAERDIVHFQWDNDMNSEVVRFVNRLSDYFYAIARYVNANESKDDVFYERSGKVFHQITKEDIDDFK